ncbi:MAG: hypothetical protein [Bacteriophage sp.]|nr:MAG: hypothetical protein [Bacteriophage sp.]
MKLTKEQYDALPEGLKALYVLNGDSYEPTFMTADQVAASEKGLKDKNAELLGKIKTGKDAADEAERLRLAELDEANRKAGNVDALDASWKKKVEELTAAHTAELESRDGFINATLIDSKAQELATALGGKSAAIFLPHIKPRLSVEKAQDGSYQTRILDAAGQPSALTMDELAKEFRSNEAFAGSIVDPGSSGLGGGLRNQGEPAKKQDFMGSVSGNGDMLAEAMKLAAD